MSRHFRLAPFAFGFFIPLFLLPFLANAYQHCSEGFDLELQKRNMSCIQKTSTVEFGWSYHDGNRSLNVLVGARLDNNNGGWLAWGINPGKEARMEGTRALIGLKQENGSLAHEKYNITHFTKLGCQLLPSPDIDLTVPNFKFFYIQKIEYYVIEATIEFPPEFNVSKANFVWQVGENVDGWEPKMHPKKLDNLDSKETVSLTSGAVLSFELRKIQYLRKVHGVVNIVSWGTFLPVGVIAARYFRKHPFAVKGWFKIHIACQIIGWMLGTAGWIMGIWLGYASKYYAFRKHGILAMIIFAFTTLQMLALWLRPSKKDDFRKYWAMYHHFLGYSLLAIISANIFLGIGIMSSDHNKWKWAYIGLLCLLGLTAFSLEIYSWQKFFADKKKDSAQKNPSPEGQQQEKTSGPDRLASLKSEAQPDNTANSRERPDDGRQSRLEFAKGLGGTTMLPHLS